MPFDSQDFFGDVLEDLRSSGLAFIVCGGVAAILHGVERTTLDIDLSVSLAPENISLLITALENVGLQPRLPVNPHMLGEPRFVKSMLEEKQAMVFTFFHPRNPYLHLDIFIKPELSYEILIPFSEEIPFRNASLRVLTAEKLLELKEGINPPRPKDKMDIEILNQLVKKQ